MRWRCGCGLVNYTLGDWICHFRYSGWRTGLRHLLSTRLERTP